jgi:hypothetical protein
MRDAPTGEQLLDTARMLLRDELLPVLPAERKHSALMIANAMSIAMRQLHNGDGGDREEFESLNALLFGNGARALPASGSELRGQLKELNRELSRRIREGKADAGEWREAARLHVDKVIRAKLMESNPKYLGGQGG